MDNINNYASDTEHRHKPVDLGIKCQEYGRYQDLSIPSCAVYWHQ
jgi:hypothetical protein